MDGAGEVVEGFGVYLLVKVVVKVEGIGRWR